ncbi:DUF2730 family protein [Sinorhizobium medicae]|uniref:DUF2730 family protein n=1 Tax=Sinorhizobium medicae TaxID=110321 RepID=UPI0004628DE3|nr:DUF2730 family protein [Sinorhizobium medicae]
MIEETMRIWSGPIASALAVISIIYTWLTARSKANEGKINSHERKLTEHDRRIQALEGEVKHLPDKDEFNELRISIEQVKGGLGRLEESHSGVSRVVRRIEDYLMKERP